jgi:hypothetical protein
MEDNWSASLPALVATTTKSFRLQEAGDSGFLQRIGSTQKVKLKLVLSSHMTAEIMEVSLVSSTAVLSFPRPWVVRVVV